MRQRLLSLVLGLGMMFLAACTSLPSAPALSPASSPSEAASQPAKTVQSPAETEPAQGAVRRADTADDAGPPQDSPLLGGEQVKELERGIASWYGPRFHGRRTASGERFDMRALTAAHKTLPFGTLVRVRHLGSGREVDVRITDRGPFRHGRVIDVSQAAADALGMLDHGVNNVLLMVPESLNVPIPKPAPARPGRTSKRNSR